MERLSKKRRNKHKGSRRIAWGRVGILLVAVVIIGGVAVFGSTKLWGLLFHNPYEQYEVYNEETKTIGEMQHDTKEKEDTYYISCYYPQFDIKKLDDTVAAYRKEHVKADLKHTGMYFVSVDYDVEEIYDTYINLVFHQKIVDENDKVLKQQTTYYAYDKKKDKMMDVSDVLRRDYIAMMKKQAKENNIDEKEIKKANLNQFTIGKKAVTFYLGEKLDKKITIPYEENKKYIALTNKNIPSLYMKDPILPTAQPKVDANKKMIAFTFDDGPHAKNTKLIMDELEKYNGRGTFFMLGQNAEAYPDIVKEVYKRGHEVANHSWDHSDKIAVNGGSMDAQQVTEEVYKPNDAIFQATGYEPKFFRPPYGAINNTLDSVCGMNMVMWDIDSEDWRNHDANKMTDIILDNVAVGYEVILMHDIHEDTVEGVKKALKELDAQGYQFVTLNTLLEHDSDYLMHFNETRTSNIVIPSSIE